MEMEMEMEKEKEMKGKVAMVTGASSGLGKDFCLSLASHGCHVVAAARRTNLLRDLLQQLEQPKLEEEEEEGIAGRPYHALIELDLSASEESLLDAAVQKAWDAFGRIDILINNAGLTGRPSSSARCSIILLSYHNRSFPEKECYVYVTIIYAFTYLEFDKLSGC